MQAQLSLLLKSQHKLFADPRRISLLTHIQTTGSISQGAKLAGISYKSAWDAINEMNTLADTRVVEKATGGKGGGGAKLTAYGVRLISLFTFIEKIQQKAFDVLHDDVPLESLLAAIARFSLQTSARNQLFGTIEQCDTQSPQQHITVQLADGSTHLQVLLTAQSVQRLELQKGKEVLVLIKAPWINLSHTPTDDENQLLCTVKSILPGERQSEIILALASGLELCALLDNTLISDKGIQERMSITAHFPAEAAVIATLV
ncbi:MAG: Transcriptional regulator ModE [Candidatus Erwinia impunctatus]|nr:Transcriptional regulator ModE [Culicoides impunctatus]